MATNNATVAKASDEAQLYNPFHPPASNDEDDSNYPFAQFKPFFPNVTWEPLTEVHVEDRGLHADPSKKRLLNAATKVKHLATTLGTELEGIDLRYLTPEQKDDLALLVAERGVVVFRDQEIDVHQQLELARYYGPLHKHPTTPIPRCGLEEVHVIYNDAAHRPDPSTYSRVEMWHSDVTYELQPPSVTSLNMLVGPETGGDTLWTSAYALYSSLSPGFQKYLEGLTALHSAVGQAEGAKAAGITVRRKAIETVHPVVRVHPVTGWKSVYVNPSFTKRIIGVPSAESDAILSFLYRQMSENYDNQLRFKWEPKSFVLWDNRITLHTGTFDFWPATRHALRATPHGERPMSVKEYEEKTGKEAKDRQVEIWKQQGLNIPNRNVSNGVQKKRN